ncbi:Calmodulin-binding domain [Quillaja saponaria]|uniref:Calmodulin-binding domain n=1 Tax=Quillaja saponaria TaxID=32244 RepID=A0AAD7QBI6_QUISA|nr:Calmodulin-binding domain [Quillaja saponaria]
MTDESIDSPLTPENIEPQGGQKKINSTGKIDILNNRAKILSRYLRGPTGSCHDLCIYGIRHDSEASPRSPMQKTVAARSTGLAKETRKRNLKPEELKQTSLPKKNEIAESKKLLHGSCTPRKSEIRSKKGRTSIMDEKKSLVPLIVSLSPKHSVKKSSTINANTDRNLERLSYLKNQKNAKEVKSEMASDEDFPEKTLHIIECSAEYESVVSTPTGVTTNLHLSSSSSCESRKLKHAHKVKPEQTSNEDFPEKTLHVIESSTKNEYVVYSSTGVTTNFILPSSSSSEVRSLKNAPKGILNSGSPPSSRKRFRRAGNGIHPMIPDPSSYLFHRNNGWRHIRSIGHPHHHSHPCFFPTLSMTYKMVMLLGITKLKMAAKEKM